MPNAEIDWTKVKRVLIVRLRSIGDTVLATPSLIALRRFLPESQIDILLEDWVAPLLDGFEPINQVIAVGKTAQNRLKTAWRIRRNKYDLVINLHGGTTSTFFLRASGSRHRVGFENYQYNFLYNHLLSSSADFWKQEKTHSAEQQLALLGFLGIHVSDRPKSQLTITQAAGDAVSKKLGDPVNSKIALVHPVAAFPTKQWATENFARVAEYLDEKGFTVVAVGTKKESSVLEKLKTLSKVSINTFDDLTLPEITALAAKASLFVGNDSGIAHIAAAVKTPTVVIFGSSNRAHWSPWTDAPNEVVFEEFDCQPCPGYVCEKFGEPKCILSVKLESVLAAIEAVVSR